jgi:hypothetical protein
MKKVKLTDAELELIYFILKRTADYQWDGCLGGHDESDKVAVKKYNKNMLMVSEICEKLRK